jgi:hypothetical protein
MKRLAASVLVTALASAVPLLAADNAIPGRAPRVVTRGAPPASATVQPKAAAASYSVQVNVVTRVQGTSLFKTSIDITNNTTTDGVTATFQYCYNDASGFRGCTTRSTLPPLFGIDNFHTDDMVAYIGSLGLIDAAAQASSFGTLLVTFDGLPSNNGWEGTVTARTYSPAAGGTVAIAYPGSLFFESASGTLVATIRDTTTQPTEAGALRTNLGVANTDLFGVGPVSVQLTFYDVTPGTASYGAQVGNTLHIDGLQPGEVRQLNNVFGPQQANIPADVLSCIVFVDVTAGGNGTDPPTVEGYVVILDGGTQDGAFFEMKCAAGCATF